MNYGGAANEWLSVRLPGVSREHPFHHGMFQVMPEENASHSVGVRAYLKKSFAPGGQRLFGGGGFSAGPEIPLLVNLQTLRHLNAL